VQDEPRREGHHGRGLRRGEGPSGRHLGAADHVLIALARDSRDPDLLGRVYERRVLAETMISRPVMKAYKAMLREVGVLGGMVDEVAY
jgi:hypothetical protein